MRRTGLFAIALMLCFSGLSLAKPRFKERYFVKLLETHASKGTLPGLSDKAEKGLIGLMAANPRFVATLKGAPNPDKSPAAYKKYLTKKRLRAFTLRIKIVGYKREVTAAKPGKSGQILKVTVRLALLGESIPDSTLAMAGHGRSTVGLEIGKKPRPRDEAYCAEEALKAALSTALNDALLKLRTAPRSKPAKK